MNNNQKHLIANWLNNLTNNTTVNEEVLLIHFDENFKSKEMIEKIVNYVKLFCQRGTHNRFITKEEVKPKDNKSNDFYAISDLDAIYVINNDTSLETIHKIQKRKHNNLIIAINQYSYNLRSISRPMLYLKDSEINFYFDEIEENFNLSINKEDRHLYYVEHLSIENLLLDKDYLYIEDFLLNSISKYIMTMSLNTLIKDTSYKKTNFRIDDLIEQDISLLVHYEILTSRLAIILFRLSFLDSEANKTKVGRYFSDKLHCKSKTINLQHLYLEDIFLLDLGEKSFRGYDLTLKPKTEEEIRVEIAIKLKKYKVDEKIIFKATRVSKEMLLKARSK